MSTSNPGPAPHLLFSYGTLREPGVQASVLGADVSMDPDAVMGHVLGQVKITDPAVIALSGSDVHPALVPSGSDDDRVLGVVLTLDDAQLAAADVYESAAYARTWVRLASGRSAWAYLPSAPAAATGAPPARRCALVLHGLGPVGLSLLRLLGEREVDLRVRHGLQVSVVAAVDSRGAAIAATGLDLEEVLAAKARGGSIADLPTVGRPGLETLEVLAELEALGHQAQVLVAAGPGDLVDGGAGLAAVVEARQRGLGVVLADKAPLALAWEQVTGPGAPVRYSACAGAALPSVDLARTMALSATVTRVEVALSSTCQRVLRAVEAGSTVEESIAAAQREGLAEADPSMDVDGLDTAVKLVILTSSLGHHVPLHQVQVTGIREVSTAGLRAARERGRAVVLLGTAEPAPAGSGEQDPDSHAGPEPRWHLTVEPRELTAEHPLARMDAQETGVVVHTDVAGRITASGLHHDVTAAAAAVLRDIVLMAQGLFEHAETSG